MNLEGAKYGLKMFYGGKLFKTDGNGPEFWFKCCYRLQVKPSNYGNSDGFRKKAKKEEKAQTIGSKDRSRIEKVWGGAKMMNRKSLVIFIFYFINYFDNSMS